MDDLQTFWMWLHNSLPGVLILSVAMMWIIVDLLRSKLPGVVVAIGVLFFGAVLMDLLDDVKLKAIEGYLSEPHAAEGVKNQ